MAMPWKRAKAKAAAIRADTSGKMLADLTRLFDACFRIQARRRGGRAAHPAGRGERARRELGRPVAVGVR